MADTDAPPAPPPVTLSLNALRIVKDAQQQHGLRHGDYMRYRQYCAQRVRRIRKSVKFTHQHKSGLKHAAKFGYRPVSKKSVNDHRFLLIPLFDAERCWAYAMQLKHDTARETNKRLQHHMMCKLRRSMKHSNTLSRVCVQLKSVDAATKLEARAYNAWIHGCFYFESKKWAEAIKSLNTAQTIYTQLSSVFTSDASVYTSRCEDMVPMLRYCSYELGDKSVTVGDLMRLNIDDSIGSEIERLMSSKQSAAQTTTQWCGHRIDIAQFPKLMAFYNVLAQFDGATKKLKTFDEKLSAYETLLSSCRDAMQAVRDATQQNSTEINDSRTLISAYLSYMRLVKTNERYLLMIENTKETTAAARRTLKHVDLVRLYDNILQNLAELQTLSGIDAAALSDIESQRLYFMVIRCYHVAGAYTQQRKWGEAQAMYERTITRANSLPDAQQKQLQSLIAEIKTAINTCTANRLMSAAETKEAPTTETNTTPLLSSPQSYRRMDAPPTNLVQLPPPYLPAPCKPLYFDLALNHVKFPSLPIEAQNVNETKSSSTTAATKDTSAAADGGDKPQGIAGLASWFWSKK